MDYTEDKNLLIQNAIEEASVDGPEGMAAVTTVVLNRLKDQGWFKGKDSISDVVLQPKQFSWTEDGDKLKRQPKDYGKYWGKAEAIVSDTVEKWFDDNDYLTKGADHYMRTDILDDIDWENDMEDRGAIGNHTFFKYKK